MTGRVSWFCQASSETLLAWGVCFPAHWYFQPRAGCLDKTSWEWSRTRDWRDSDMEDLTFSTELGWAGLAGSSQGPWGSPPVAHQAWVLGNAVGWELQSGSKSRHLPKHTTKLMAECCSLSISAHFYSKQPACHQPGPCRSLWALLQLWMRSRCAHMDLVPAS